MKTCPSCGHIIGNGVQVCLADNCDCLCFISENSETFPREGDWKEASLLAVLDLLLGEQEGEVQIRTKDGRECHIRVSFETEVGYTITAHGGNA